MTKPAASSSKLSPRARYALWAAAAVGLALVAYVFVVRRRGAQGGAVDTSGRPGPDLSGSAAQQPNGGASSVPSKLPSQLVSEPDPVTQQVQTTDASSSDAPTTSSSSSSLPAGGVDTSGSIAQMIAQGLDPAIAVAVATQNGTPTAAVATPPAPTLDPSTSNRFTRGD